MDKLTLNDNTELENSSAHESGGYLYIYVQNGFSLRAVFELLIDPERTEKIIKTEAGTDTVYWGYDRLIAVRDEENGYITAVMRK